MFVRTLTRSIAALAAAGLLSTMVSAQGPAPAKQAPPAPAKAAPAAATTAGETYLAYLAAMKTAKKAEDVLKFWPAANIAEFNKTPAAERPQMFDMLKTMVTMNTNVKVVKETPTAKGATLAIEGVGPDGKTKQTGTVEMVKEGGAWKVGNESWKG
jgi:hypothetical protein